MTYTQYTVYTSITESISYSEYTVYTELTVYSTVLTVESMTYSATIYSMGTVGSDTVYSGGFRCGKTIILVPTASLTP